MLVEFKKFALRGNVIDLAICVAPHLEKSYSRWSATSLCRSWTPVKK